LRSLAAGKPRHLEIAVPKPRQKSQPGLFWAFVNENPKLASSIAFEIGFLAGKISRGASLDQLKQLSPSMANALPQIAQAALKYLPAMTSSAASPAESGRRANGAARLPRKRKARKP
jgi:hypothetical protein